ncbi:MAG: hypothetical protein GTO14_00495 [Anaerolineales bacterium]|nr:hypothetical protein [Anaerolineales bacterium]
MISRQGFDYENVLTTLDNIAYWAGKACTVLILAAMILMNLSPIAVAHAEPEDPADEAAIKLLDIFGRLAKMFVRVAYSLMFIVFAVGSVKSGLGAQAAQQFGATGRVSLELLNLAGGVVIFVFGLMTLPLVNMIIDSVTGALFGDGPLNMVQPEIDIR